MLETEKKKEKKKENWISGLEIWTYFKRKEHFQAIIIKAYFSPHWPALDANTLNLSFISRATCQCCTKSTELHCGDCLTSSPLCLPQKKNCLFSGQSNLMIRSWVWGESKPMLVLITGTCDIHNFDLPSLRRSLSALTQMFLDRCYKKRITQYILKFYKKIKS